MEKVIKLVADAISELYPNNTREMNDCCEVLTYRINDNARYPNHPRDIISSIRVYELSRNVMIELGAIGFVCRKAVDPRFLVEVVRVSPFDDPLAYMVGFTEYRLAKDAKKILDNLLTSMLFEFVNVISDKMRTKQEQ